MNPPDTPATLRAMEAALDAYLRNPGDATTLSTTWRALAPTLGLPPRFGQVMDTLLDATESAALFDAEACAFSPRELQQRLREWLDAAQTWLQQPPRGTP